jgi:hypothetical protein
VAGLLDLWSQRIVGWAIASHLRADLVIDVLEMATGRRRPSPGLIHHSEQGTQYTSFSFGRHFRESRILPSMGRTGTPAHAGRDAETSRQPPEGKEVESRVPPRGPALTVVEYLDTTRRWLPWPRPWSRYRRPAGSSSFMVSKKLSTTALSAGTRRSATPALPSSKEGTLGREQLSNWPVSTKPGQALTGTPEPGTRFAWLPT